jgi:hypothetical protein
MPVWHLSSRISPSTRRILNDIIGGTQDNGTWAYDGRTGTWFESMGGDGGSSGINAVQPNVRMHTYFDAQIDVNFQKNETLGWDWIADPLLGSGEAQSFYVPLVADPVLAGTFRGLACLADPDTGPAHISTFR